MNRRVDKGETYKRPRKSDIEFLWIQLEDIIEHNINKDAKTKLELLQRLCQLLTKRAKEQTRKEEGSLEDDSSFYKVCERSMLPIYNTTSDGRRGATGSLV